MTDEKELDLDTELQEIEKSVEKEKEDKDNNRFRTLAEKVKATAAERDAERLAKQALEKEVGFYKGFGAVASKYPEATSFQDKIREKVNAGYELEDATISILHKEGKMGTQAAPAPEIESPAGGSATNQLPQGPKTIAEMTLAEKRAALKEALGE